MRYARTGKMRPVTLGRHSGCMDSTKHQRLADTASGQHGVFTRQDARRAGLADASLAEGLSLGRYTRVLPGVFAIAGSPASIQQRMVAIVRSLSSLAAVSHRTAAQMWDLIRPSGGLIDVVTTRWDRVPRPEVAMHESKDLLSDDIVLLDGIPVTNPVRTVVDLGAVSPWAVEWALEAGIRKGHFTLVEVERMVARVGRKGRRGVGVIRPLIEVRRNWDAAPESALEDLFRRVVDELGLPQPRPQYVVRDEGGRFVCRADFAYVPQRLLIELDSEAYHMDRLTFRRDRSKQNAATVLGWDVLRYTWWDLTEDPYRVRREIQSAIGLDRALR